MYPAPTSIFYNMRTLWNCPQYWIKLLLSQAFLTVSAEIFISVLPPQLYTVIYGILATMQDFSEPWGASKKDRWWSFDHLNLYFSIRDKLFSDKTFCSRKEVPMQPNSFSFCSCAGVPIWTSGELLCLWIFWWSFLLMRWMKDQNNRAACACEEEQNWMEYLDVCVCHARIK